MEKYTPIGAKVQQNMYLSESTVAALRSIADREGTSISAVADELLAEQLGRYRSERVRFNRMKVIEENLPASLVGVAPDHPIFGKKHAPTRVLIRRRDII